MNRLRHPVRAIREPFGTAGLIVACLALILALTGGAYAAGKLTSKQKKEVEKIAKKFAGKPGAPGAAGPAGPVGPGGPAGTAGAPGANGKDGAPGATGATGPAGKNGQTGFTATLPEGETETGVWGTPNVAQKSASYQISFPIPLAIAPTPVEVKPAEMFNGAAAAKGCPWDGTGTVTADPGKFCLYLAVGVAGDPNLALMQFTYPAYENFLGEDLGYGEAGVSTYGTVVKSACTGGSEALCEAFGAWAVTAHE